MERIDLPQWASREQWEALLRVEEAPTAASIALGARLLRARGVSPTVSRAARAALRAKLARHGVGRLAVIAHDVGAHAWDCADALCEAIEHGEPIDAVDAWVLCWRADEVDALQHALAALVSDPSASDETLERASDLRGELSATARAIEARVGPMIDALREAIERGEREAPAELRAAMWPGALPWWLDVLDQAPSRARWAPPPEAPASRGRRVSSWMAAAAGTATASPVLQLRPVDGGEARVRLRVDDAGEITATLLDAPPPEGHGPFALVWGSGDEHRAVFVKELGVFTCHPPRSLLDVDLERVTLRHGARAWRLEPDEPRAP